MVVVLGPPGAALIIGTFAALAIYVGYDMSRAGLSGVLWTLFVVLAAPVGQLAWLFAQRTR